MFENRLTRSSIKEVVGVVETLNITNLSKTKIWLAVNVNSELHEKQTFFL